MQKEETGDINYILGYRHFLPRAAFRASVSLRVRVQPAAGRGHVTAQLQEGCSLSFLSLNQTNNTVYVYILCCYILLYCCYS